MAFLSQQHVTPATQLPKAAFPPAPAFLGHSYSLGKGLFGPGAPQMVCTPQGWCVVGCAQPYTLLSITISCSVCASHAEDMGAGQAGGLAFTLG